SCDGAAKLQVAPNLRDVVEHLAQIPGNGNFFHRKRELTIADPQATGAAREVPGDQVNAEAEKFGHIETVFHISYDFLRRFAAWLEKEISRAYARIARQSTSGIGGGLQAQLFCGVGVQQIRSEQTILDHDGSSLWNTFSVEGRSAKA